MFNNDYDDILECECCGAEVWELYNYSDHKICSDCHSQELYNPDDETRELANLKNLYNDNEDI
ncbi:hypothetical protein [Vibrio parahaemolyticus]|uniref:hypothetical protein n=1 Tax=Vibrio parahaemolyticus TaxID=670 RepID=UPI002733A8D2|nr:hypothetical protein [Vibrio parahaemolyticus]WLI85652.1 hypothetical protein Q7W79_22900 [Vibrio parahaemolyticus]